jgi:hypothetical protein
MFYKTITICNGRPLPQFERHRFVLPYRITWSRLKQMVKIYTSIEANIKIWEGLNKKKEYVFSLYLPAKHFPRLITNNYR